MEARSLKVRRLAAVSLAAVGVLFNVVYVVLVNGAAFPRLEDFAAFYEASQRMLDGVSPYSTAQLEGPIDALCSMCYLYPPFLAQAISPLAILPLEVAKVVWFAFTTGLGLLAVWLATGIGGARPSMERAAWCVAATMFFFPIIHSNWLGNVGTLIMLSATLLVMGGVIGGLSVAVVTLMKVVPGALVPVALVAGPRPRVGFVAGLIGVGAICFLLAPSAWLEYPTVLVNMLAGSGDNRFNLSPAIIAERAGLPDLLVSGLRIAAILLGAACLAASVWLARRVNGLAVASLCGIVAMLLIPGTLWYGYLSVLLAFAAMAWVPAGSRARWAMFASSALITLAGPTALPLAFVGAAALVVVAGYVLWPRPTETPGLQGMA